MASSRWCTRRTGQDYPDHPGSGKWTFAFLATTFCAIGPAPQISTAKPTACTAGRELARHNGSFLGVTVSGFWHPPKATYRTPIGAAGTATTCFPTAPTFGTRTTTVCGGSGKSARRHQRMGYIWFDYWTIGTDKASSVSGALHDFDESCTRCLVSANALGSRVCTGGPA